MVDFSQYRSEDKIKLMLTSLRRQGRNRAVEFPPIEVDNFMIKVTAKDNPSKLYSFPWTLPELEKLPRITELEQIEVQIYERKPGTELFVRVHVNTDKNFISQSWASSFNRNYGLISPDVLVEIIRYIQVMSELVAFL